MSLTQINKAGLDEIALDHVFTIGASGSSAYTFQGEGLNGTVNNPTLYLTRGKTYRFENGSGGHPIRIQSTSGASGTAYNTGVTNNAGSGTVIVEVQHDAPDILYYQCTSHAAMNGILYVTGALAENSVTSAKIAAGAVTNSKIGNAQVTGAKLSSNSVGNGMIVAAAVSTDKIANAAVSTTKIADDAVTEAKLANSINSAIAANTAKASITINNNADNRVITGSGTANTLNGESNVLIDSSGRLLLGTSIEGHAAGDNLTVSDAGNSGITIRSGSSNNGSLYFSDATSGSGEYAGAVRYLHGDNALQFYSNSIEQLRINSSGNVGIGTNNPLYPLHVKGTVSGSAPADYGVLMGLSSNDDYAQIQLNGDTGAFIDFSTSGVDQKGRILYVHSTNKFEFFVNSGKRAQLTSDGFIFNGTDTTSANALDDYEEGSYVPVVKSNAGASAWTYQTHYELRSPHASGNTNSIAYTKIGNRVYLSFSIFFNTSGTDRVNISLPFAIKNDDYQCSGTCGYFQVAGAYGVTFIGNGLNSIDIMENDSNGGHPNLSFSASTEIYFNFHYQTT